MIGVSTADLSQEISSTTKVTGWVENSVWERCPNNITLVLDYMSDGHNSILGNRKQSMLKV